MTQIRSDVTRSRFNERYVAYLSVEVVIISATVGVMAASWLAALGTLVGFGVWVMSPLAGLLVWVMAAGWATAGWVVGSLLGGGVGGFVLATIGLMAGFTIHHAGAQYIRDVSNASQMDLD